MQQNSSIAAGFPSDAIDGAEMLEHTLSWIAINSGTDNLQGLSTLADALADAFSALPGEITLEEPGSVTTISPEGTEVSRLHGRHLVLRVRPEAERRLLLTGHMDTVYPIDHPFQQARWIDSDTLNGPGAADMKGGIAIILAALKTFETCPEAASIGYDVMINSDEETGSLSSAPLIAGLAQGKYAALTYEPSARPEGTYAHARGGSGNFSLSVTGRSAHAGRNPQEGRNAIVAAAALALGLKVLETPEIRINPARIDGGSGNNVVPDHAVLRFNIRPKTHDASAIFLNDLNRLIDDISTNHEVSITLHGGITRPPKPVDAKAARLFQLVQNCSTELGQHFALQDSGGVCDGNNIAACGVPVVDTMGARGGAIHSPDEYLIVPSLAERAALSALVLRRLATGEPL